jgi:hypothetical protein
METSSSADTAASAAASGTDQGRTSGTASAETHQPLSELDELRITLLRNARYHEDRERFFVRLHKGAMFIVVSSSTATLAFVRSAPLFAGLITLAGLLDLVFDVSGKARLHASLRGRVYAVLAQTENKSCDIAKLKELAVQVYADEPPTMHAVNAVAYNGAMEAFDRPKKYQLEIGFWPRALRHLHSFGTTQFPTREDAETARAGRVRA